MKLYTLLVLLPIAATAQISTAQISTTQIATTQISTTGAVGGFAMSSSGAGVSGMPYSARQVSEHVQTLADGTRITQTHPVVTFYRDSQGRTRTEHIIVRTIAGQANATTEPGIIEISDPVAEVNYTLEPRNHTARQLSRPIHSAPMTPVRPRDAGTPAFAAAKSSVSDEASRPQITREELGTQTIEGVLVSGTRVTTVFPVAFFGNDRPVTTTSEVWTSPELKVTVMSKNSDPRNGETTTRLTNISRTEPAASLFQVPSDYNIVNAQTTVEPALIH